MRDPKKGAPQQNLLSILTEEPEIAVSTDVADIPPGTDLSAEERAKIIAQRRWDAAKEARKQTVAKALQYLADHKDQAIIADKQNITPLMLAILKVDPESDIEFALVNQLKNSSTQTRDKNGRSALMYALDRILLEHLDQIQKHAVEISTEAQIRQDKKNSTPKQSVSDLEALYSDLISGLKAINQTESETQEEELEPASLDEVEAEDHFDIWNQANKNLKNLIIYLINNSSKSDLLAKDNTGCSVLYRIAELGSVELLEMALRKIHGAEKVDKRDRSLKISDKDHYNILIVAARKGHIKMVKFCLEFAPIKIDVRTALHYALKNNHSEVAEALTKAMGDWKATPNTEDHALDQCIERDDVFYMALILDNPSHKFNFRATLKNALQRNAPNVAEFIITKYGALNKLTDSEKNNELYEAAKNGRLEIVDLLLKTGKFNHTVLDEALIRATEPSSSMNPEVIELLILKGAEIIFRPGKKPEIDPEQLLERMIRSGHNKAAEILVTYGMTIKNNTTHHRDTLEAALKTGNKEVVQLLIFTQLNHKLLDQIPPQYQQEIIFRKELDRIFKDPVMTKEKIDQFNNLVKQIRSAYTPQKANLYINQYIANITVQQDAEKMRPLISRIFLHTKDPDVLRQVAKENFELFASEHILINHDGSIKRDHKSRTPIDLAVKKAKEYAKNTAKNPIRYPTENNPFIPIIAKMVYYLNCNSIKDYYTKMHNHIPAGKELSNIFAKVDSIIGEVIAIKDRQQTKVSTRPAVDSKGLDVKGETTALSIQARKIISDRENNERIDREYYEALKKDRELRIAGEKEEKNQKQFGDDKNQESREETPQPTQDEMLQTTTTSITQTAEAKRLARAQAAEKRLDQKSKEAKKKEQSGDNQEQEDSDAEAEQPADSMPEPAAPAAPATAGGRAEPTSPAPETASPAATALAPNTNSQGRRGS